MRNIYAKTLFEQHVFSLSYHKFPNLEVPIREPGSWGMGVNTDPRTGPTPQRSYNPLLEELWE